RRPGISASLRRRSAGRKILGCPRLSPHADSHAESASSERTRNQRAAGGQRGPADESRRTYSASKRSRKRACSRARTAKLSLTAHTREGGGCCPTSWRFGGGAERFPLQALVMQASHWREAFTHYGPCEVAGSTRRPPSLLGDGAMRACTASRLTALAGESSGPRTHPPQRRRAPESVLVPTTHSIRNAGRSGT